jgi:hypothetical protein
MDILQLVDRLEDLIDEGRHVPFSRLTMIDEERALNLLDQMRISIPDEIVKASTVIQERNRILEKANEDAARLLQDARQKGTELLDQDTSVQAAQARAREVMDHARRDADQVMREADQYIAHRLRELEIQLTRVVNEVRNGIAEVEQPAASITAAYDPSALPIMIQQQQDISAD